LLELIVEGPDPGQTLQRELTSGRVYELGRSPTADIPVTWDRHISRKHIRLTPSGDLVVLEQFPNTSNPIFYSGSRVHECRVKSGERFVIGSTSFRVVSYQTEQNSPSDRSIEEVTFDRKELHNTRFRDANKRIDVLAHLPEVISGAGTESELHQRLANLILAGVEHADAAAIVEQEEDGTVNILHWERRRETAGAFLPSARLVRNALRKRRQSVLHVWETLNRSTENYTEVAEFDWAFCTPIPDPVRNSQGLYVAGRLDHPAISGKLDSKENILLQADVKFTEIVAEIISSVQLSNRLERQQSGFRQFFAPPILQAIGEDLDTDLLVPRECDVTVLFCDLRGFSQTAEESSDDLIGLLDRVSRALGVMTQQILKHGGVTGDFQGDAALGFWGWPLSSENAVLDACKAALGIRAAFRETRDRKDHPLANFEMGIGIAHGRAVAGKIGTSEQVKVTVFGPVVNLASRLESMTKQLRVPILIDAATAQTVQARLDPTDGRLRRLAKVLPYGFETPLIVSELLPPESEYSELTDEHLADYEKAVDHFIAGEWKEAYKYLHQIPEGDRAQDFLGILIAQHNRLAPPNWDGVVRLSGK
jgi:adenylate cyclase